MPGAILRTVRSALPPLAAVLLVVPVLGQVPEVAELPSSTATLAVGRSRSPLPVSPGLQGPLFLLQPIVDRIGGELYVGPTDESHRLVLPGTEALFGPGSGTMTVGTEVVPLTQAPVLTEAGLRVPIDVLRKSYGDLLGLEFRWSASEAELRVERRQPEVVDVELEVVHISGITTVVVQFAETPTYEVRDRGRVVDIEVPIDEVRLAGPVRMPRRSLLQEISMSEHLIRLELADGAASVACAWSSTSPRAARW